MGPKGTSARVDPAGTLGDTGQTSSTTPGSEAAGSAAATGADTLGIRRVRSDLAVVDVSSGIRRGDLEPPLPGINKMNRNGSKNTERMCEFRLKNSMLQRTGPSNQSRNNRSIVVQNDIRGIGNDGALKRTFEISRKRQKNVT